MNTSVNGFFPRVSLGFARKIDTDLIAFVRNVITLMTGNIKYPTPLPTLATMTTAVNGFEVAVHEALDGGKIPIATRNALRVELLSLVRQLAAYVQGNCDADLVILLGSGFEAVRAPSPVGVLPAPGNQRLSLTDKSGELLFRFDRVPNAANYSVQTAIDDIGPWTDQDLSTAARVTLNRPHPRQGLLGASTRQRLSRLQRMGRSCHGDGSLNCRDRGTRKGSARYRERSESLSHGIAVSERESSVDSKLRPPTSLQHLNPCFA